MKYLFIISNNKKETLILRIILDDYIPPPYSIITTGDIDSNGNYVIENTHEILITKRTYELIKNFQITSIYQLKSFNRKNKKKLKIFLKIQWKNFLGKILDENVNYTYENIETINSNTNNYMNFVIQNILVDDYNFHFKDSNIVWHVYLRISEKNGVSLNTQLSHILEKAKQKGAFIGSILIHNGISARKGRNLQRRDFQYFINNILQNFQNFTNELHIYCPDRLSRGKREANDLIDEMRLYNIPICFDLGTQCASSMNDGDMIYINKDLQEAEELSDKTSERVRMSLKRKRENPLPGMNYLSLENKKDSTLDYSDDSDDIEDSDDEYENIDYSNEVKKFRIVGSVNRTFTINDYHYKIQSVPGDGNCMLYAILLAIRNSYSVREIRRLISNYMLDNRDDFIEHYVPSDHDGKSFEEYVGLIRRTNEWCDHMCLIAIQNVLNQPIHVFQDNNGELSETNDVTIDNDNEPIFIYYNGHNHYDALIRESNNRVSMIDNILSYFRR